MAVDKNLFIYDLAVVAIMKNEGPYIKEWLDYHLLAGVEHFYIYDNESPDNQKKILEPYIDAGIVTYIFYPGKARQHEAYFDAVQNYRFFCRYMAFIDGDEFIFPQANKNIVEVIDEILADNPKAAGVAINWHQFGSNFQETADYSRGVLERCTRRASDKNIPINPKNNLPGGNAMIKTIANPRRIDYFFVSHFPIFFNNLLSVNENGEGIPLHFNNPPTVKKIVINHYPFKSREEYEKKVARGAADSFGNIYLEHPFEHVFNEEFDDEILKYRAFRKNFFGIKDDSDIIKKFSDKNEINSVQRIFDALCKNLISADPKNPPKNFFEGKVENFLTCLAVSEKFQFKFENNPSSQYALYWLYLTLRKNHPVSDWFLVFNVLPEILRLPYSMTEKIREVCLILIPEIIPYLASNIKGETIINTWKTISELKNLQKMLKTFGK